MTRTGSWLRRPALWIIVIAALAAGALLVRRARGPEVRAVAVERRPLEQHLVASGRVETPALVALAPAQEGRVVAVMVDEGDHVAAGDVLVELDPSAARVEVARAEAGLAQAEARWRKLRGFGVVQAAQGRARADANLERARREAERVRQLAARGAASAADLDDVERALRVATAERDEARAAEAATGAKGADSALAVAELAQARAQLDAARLRLEDQRVRAPQPGLIVGREVEVGQVVSPSRTLLTLAADGPARLGFETDERNLGLLEVGQAARASADAYPDAAFDAVVDRIASSVDPQRGTVAVRLRLPAPPAFLLADMTVSIDVTVRRAASALIVPLAAVRAPTSATPWVWVAEHGRAARRDVVLGVRGDDLVELTSGVTEGELVLVPGATPLEAGARVRPARVEPAP